MRRKIIYIIVLIMIALCVFVGCSEKDSNTTKQVGTKVSSGIYFDCDLTNNEFDVNDVKLTIMYGWMFSLELNKDVETCEMQLIIFDESTINSPIVIRNVQDFATLDYVCTANMDDNYNIVDIQYAHSEIIAIPNAILKGNQGTIRIEIRGIINNTRKKSGYLILSYIVDENGILSFEKIK